MSYAPTPQQQASIDALLNPLVRMLQLRACAGAGKTSTLVLMAEAVKEPSLYLAFNKVTADEGASRFPSYVECKTTHSKAYAAFGAKLRNKLNRPKGKYVNVAGTGSEIARFYDIDDVVIDENPRITAPYIGLLVKSAVTRFEQSADMAVGDKHIPKAELLEKLGKGPAFTYVLNLVLKFAKLLWADRINVNTVVLATHDTYLKQFQLSKPVFPGINVLYVDEFQDTTPCVLDIVMNQRDHMKIVMVGDARQAIYGWRGAVNAMEAVEGECEVRMLTKSFRYGQAVADVATAILEGDMVIEGFEKLHTVAGQVEAVDITKPYTRLFRTNSALLESAINSVRNGTPVAIEIDTRDFVKLLESAVALYRKDAKGVKHDKIVPYQNWDELLGEAKNDPELGRVSKVVANGQADEWIRVLAYFQNAADPHITFTTAHKSKGREWHQVIVENDFKSGFDEDGEWVGLVTEEQNLLYVACTRAQEVLQYNGVTAEYIRRYAQAANDTRTTAEVVEDEFATIGAFESIEEREGRVMTELLAA